MLTALSLAFTSVVLADVPLPPSPPRNMSDPYYTAFHFQPLKNWMNDPNGPMYDEATGLYHLFAQYNPKGAKWGDMNWYHAVSKDMLHWAHLPIALTPDHGYDCGGEFSGSATVLPDAAGTPVLSVSVACGKWVFFAIPEDKAKDPLMINWKKNGTMPISGAEFSGPVFNAPAYSTGGFRDPTSAWQGTDKVWRMATGCGDKKKGGACLFKSENFVNWTAVGWLDQPQGPQNPSFWECPDFFEVPGTGKYVMKGSCSGDWWSLGDYTEVAGMKEDTFAALSYEVHGGSTAGLGLQKYDFGQFYASKSFYDPAKKRQVLWGWVAEEGRAPHAGEDWSSIQSLPRSILIDPTNSSRLMFPPIEELSSLRGAAIAVPATVVKAGASIDLSKMVPASTGNQLDIELTITGDFTKDGVAAGVSVLNDATGKGNYVFIASNVAAKNPEGINLLTLNNQGHQGQSVIGPSFSAVPLRVIVDRSAVEAYSAGGRGVATKRTYPTADMRGVSLVNSGTVDVSITATIYPMATAQPPSMEELLL